MNTSVIAPGIPFHSTTDPVPSQQIGDSEVHNNPSFIFLQLYHTTGVGEESPGRTPLLLPGGEVGGVGRGGGRSGGGVERGEVGGVERSGGGVGRGEVCWEEWRWDWKRGGR